MNATLRNLLLSATLIAVPAIGFTMAEIIFLPGTSLASGPVTIGSGLGDLSAYRSIVTDTQGIAATGGLVAAEQRITDLETLWDQNASDLRKADAAAWGTIDGAADDAFSALRARSPDPAAVNSALSALLASLDNPAPTAATGAVQQVLGIDVTDANGHALPCEEMTGKVRDAFAAITPTAEMLDLQAKALERCNADDDARSDAFAAQALSMIKG
ncbi:MAG: hypothetical protein WBN04_05405 [Paracoccaceae bacterium]